jgi:hypothetical protein
MIAAELDALPVMMPFETACRVLSIGGKQGYRLRRDGLFPVRVLEINGRSCPRSAVVRRPCYR